MFSPCLKCRLLKRLLGHPMEGCLSEPRGDLNGVEKEKQIVPEGTKHATSVNVQLPRLRKDRRTGSISRNMNFPSELCRRRSGMFTEVARLVPPESCYYYLSIIV